MNKKPKSEIIHSSVLDKEIIKNLSALDALRDEGGRWLSFKKTAQTV